VARGARGGCFGIPVTTDAGCGIKASFYPVPREPITAVRRATVGFGLVFDRRLQLHARCMAVITETLLVAHGANPAVLICLLPMVITKVGVMVETLPVEIFIVGFMAICANGGSFAKPCIRRVLSRQHPSVLVSNTCRQRYCRQQKWKHHVYFFQHLIPPVK